MDPRMKQVLLMLLQMMIEQGQTQGTPDPMMQPEDPKDVGVYPPGTKGYNAEQLAQPTTHYVWPFTTVDSNFGAAC